MPLVDVLLPTCNRRESLILTLSGIAAQSMSDLRVVVADQSETPVAESPVVQALGRIITARGGTIEWHHRREVHGIAEQRDFLLRQATAESVLYVDDDVFMEPWVVARLHQTLAAQQCGFVGAFPAGLSFASDVRPAQQIVHFWDGPVQPEPLEPDSPDWERWQLHRAANVWHASQKLRPGETRLYKVAWVAACVLYDRVKLCDVGGFAFWPRLPRYHSGEEVLVQNLLIRRWGACAILPSGAYAAELPSTVLNPQGAVDGHALDLLPEMVERFVTDRQGTPGSESPPPNCTTH